MIKRFILLLFALPLLAAGCAHVPFEDTALVDLDAVDPHSMVERFRTSIPENYQLLTTVVFEYNSRKFSGIGTMEINNPDRLFKVACMNPMGVKLFELSGDHDRITTLYAMPAFTKYGDMPAAVGNDIRRIYFDLVPGRDAKLRRGKYRLFFRQASGRGFLEYVFGGAGGDLLEKRYYAEDGIVWKASYYEYQDQSGKRWPRGIVFLNYQYGYRLTVRQKELHA